MLRTRRDDRVKKNGKRGNEQMKQVELKLICELMKNSRRSDRELAKAIGTSQPTVTRIRNRLEKEGYIKEYTMLPDFKKLGFEIMALMLVRYSKEMTAEQYEKVKRAAKEYEKKNPRAVLMAVRGMGLGFDRAFISFHENYASYANTLYELQEQLPFNAVAGVDSFLVNLAGEEHYQPFTFFTVAQYLAKMKGKNES
jgi:DNA-binding Lrp family transcriptional regulator